MGIHVHTSASNAKIKICLVILYFQKFSTAATNKLMNAKTKINNLNAINSVRESCNVDMPAKGFVAKIAPLSIRKI